MSQKIERAAWRPRELARKIGCAPSTVYGWIRDGRLPAVRAGPGTLLVMDADWREFILRGRRQLRRPR